MDDIKKKSDYRTEYYKAHGDARRSYQRDYYLKNKEMVRNKQRLPENQKKIAAYAIEYNKRPDIKAHRLEYMRDYNQNKRSKKQIAESQDKKPAEII